MSSAQPGRLGRRVIHDGRIVQLSIDTVRFPDGSVGELELIHHAGASAVLPIAGPLDDPDPEVLLIRQYRYATGGYLYEVPAGTPHHDGEPWEEVARRELEEETGWRAERLFPLTRVYTTPGFTDEVIHIWLATDLRQGASKLDDDEFVELVRTPLSVALAWIREGRIIDAKSVVAILFAARFVRGDGRSGW